ncbi:MAG: recombination mediator RecR, partial [Chloroflexota bacterium]|nr:recombination mediator RecR [Chloroflexota bacterium]
MHIEPIARAVEAFATLPGIGPKTAQRLTFHLLRQPPETVRGLAEAIQRMKEAVHFCSVCGNVTDVEPCSICGSDQRDRSTICVVEDPLAIITLERTRIYKGLYHVLHGALDPLHGVTVEDLKIEELVRRVHGGTAGELPVQEVILATNPNVEGDTTAGYLERRLAPLGVRVTRLARG